MQKNKTKKILVVDDEADFLKILKRIITDEGYNVIAASNGSEALTKLREEAPDLMLLDIDMPVMNGYEVCKEIRKDPIYKNIPVIMLTVLSKSASVLKGMETGCDEYITKPFSSRELILRIQKVLNKPLP